MEKKESVNKIIRDLRERAKEIKCLYQVQEVLSDQTLNSEELCKKIVRLIPPGFQYPDVCSARIILGNKKYSDKKFDDTDWELGSDIQIRGETSGRICVFYTEERPSEDIGPFLKEERKLLNSIADQMSMQLLHNQLKTVFEEGKLQNAEKKSEWWIILDLLKRTDPRLLVNIAQKMLNYLCLNGVSEAESFIEEFNPSFKKKSELFKDNNFPMSVIETSDIFNKSNHVFDIASRSLSENEILDIIQKWIKEDRSNFMVNILENTGSSLPDISNAIERYHHLSSQGLELSVPRAKSFRVALTRRVLTDQPGFVKIAKENVKVDDFNGLMKVIIHPARSHGKVGGKSSGLFLAEKILKNSGPDSKYIKNIKFPRSWYITSDGLLEFIKYNSLEDIVEQKYKDIGQVRQEYPYVVQVFKNSTFPPDIVKGLTLALDDLGDRPLIVRSSSLLEDRFGTSFAGKYKSLFIANIGSREERLESLTGAIAEIYASTFGPEPIEYRNEHGLIDYLEEMGIIIQQVVGSRIGDYFLPSFVGVAFGNNEYKWSPRLDKEDGLIRVVPGLGTRAVDRISDDYPVLISPGKPDLSVNASIEEKIKYSPKKVDLINLSSGKFDTVDLSDLLFDHGNDYPWIENIISVVEEKYLRPPKKIGHDYKSNYHLATFEGLKSGSVFLSRIKLLLEVFREKYGAPVDLEFASDGKDLYILQCRPQSFSKDSRPAVIPEDSFDNEILFSAEKHVPNGTVQDITHIVYVDPDKYPCLSTFEELYETGRIISRLNKILPKRQFVLIGPGRWGSRGDIKLGVSVTYSDINNTAMLIEVAKKRKEFIPDLSFGTHFFQDLVEAEIKYLPLYPDSGTILNEKLLKNAKNILPSLIPGLSAELQNTVRVIDIPSVSEGKELHIYMNSEIQKAVGIISETPTISSFDPEETENRKIINSDFHWKWRLSYVKEIASSMDGEKFGIKAFYIFGSVKNATAGPASDIDILIHFCGNAKQKNDLEMWLNGWDRSLVMINYLSTGNRTDNILDVHYITDKDIKNRTSYAVKIGAHTDPARPLEIKRPAK